MSKRTGEQLLVLVTRTLSLWGLCLATETSVPRTHLGIEYMLKNVFEGPVHFQDAQHSAHIAECTRKSKHGLGPRAKGKRQGLQGLPSSAPISEACKSIALMLQPRNVMFNC